MKKVFFFLLTTLIIFNTYSQYDSWILKNKETEQRLRIKKYRQLVIFIGSSEIKGQITEIDDNYLKLRINNKDFTHYEYIGVPIKKAKYNKRIEQGWIHISPSTNDSLSFDFSDSIYFMRSTNLQSIKYSEIDSIKYSKAKGWDNGGIEAIGLPLLLITSPLWNYSDGNFDWIGFGGLVGINIWYFGKIAINHERAKWITYRITPWQTLKVK